MSKHSVIGFLASVIVLLICNTFQSVSSRNSRRRCDDDRYFDKFIRNCRSCSECCPPRPPNFMCEKECNLEKFCSAGDSITTPGVSIVVEPDDEWKVPIILAVVAAVVLVILFIIVGAFCAARNGHFSHFRRSVKAVEVTPLSEENRKAYNEQVHPSNSSQSSSMDEPLKQSYS